MFLAPISVGIFLLAKDFWTCGLALVILTISNTMVTPSFASIIADIIPRIRRGRVYALIGENGIQVSTARLQGGGLLLIAPAALGSAIGGYLYEYNTASPFVIVLASLIVALVFTHFKIHEPEQAAH
jgi:MFS family permease